MQQNLRRFCPQVSAGCLAASYLKIFRRSGVYSCIPWTQ